MGSSAVLEIALGVVTAAAVVLLLVGVRRRWRSLAVNAGISAGFLAFFWIVTATRELEADLSNTGIAILTGIAVVGIAQFANALTILIEGTGRE